MAKSKKAQADSTSSSGTAVLAAGAREAIEAKKAPATPMLLQYRNIRRENPDAILFFRMGDFYEMFDDQAELVSRLLSITLTERAGVAMCGIPYHARDIYLPRLLAQGCKVAICEQVSEPGKGGIVEREVVEVITPGTLIAEDHLASDTNHYLLSILPFTQRVSASQSAGADEALGAVLAYVDLSTGEFVVEAVAADREHRALSDALQRISPREILCPADDRALVEGLLAEDLLITSFPAWHFDSKQAEEQLCKLFGFGNLHSLGFTTEDPVLGAVAPLLSYLKDEIRASLSHLEPPRLRQRRSFVLLDESTQKNLELVQNLRDGGSSYTLLETLSQTKTPMGLRLLKSYLLNPLYDLKAIAQRHERVAHYVASSSLRAGHRSLLAQVRDIDRVLTRLSMGRASRDQLLKLAASLKAVLDMCELEPELVGSALRRESVASLRQVSELISRALAPVGEGDIIASGYSPELDHLRLLRDHADQSLADYEAYEQERTGIQKLKIGQNRVLGLYIEVRKTRESDVPADFIQRQTLVNAQRYTTERLMAMESELVMAREQASDLESKLFAELAQLVLAHFDALREAGRMAGEVDVYCSFAEISVRGRYVRPVMTDDGVLNIVDGRHPVVEAHVEAGSFVPNSLTLSDKRFCLITGPNMSGKSTYLRQNALIILMAHIGCFVPAAEAQIPLIDGIFCRVGASDNLARGESTFLVEMKETAYILRQATDKSFVIMDEVGRGTGTTDGLSIAWAISEYLLAHKTKSLFATHYLELAELEHELLMRSHLEVARKGSEIYFLKSIKEGIASGSYGLAVAKLAGVPAELIARAEALMQVFQGHHSLPEGSLAQVTASSSVGAAAQLDLFAAQHPALERLAGIDPDELSPRDALDLIFELKDLV